MSAPLSTEHTLLILAAVRDLDDRTADNLIDHVSHTLSEIDDPHAEDVRRAIIVARRALRKAGAY